MKVGNYQTQIWKALKHKLLHLLGLSDVPGNSFWYPMDGWVSIEENPREFMEAFYKDEGFRFTKPPALKK